MSKQCIVCGGKNSLDGHHLYPLEYGGKDDGPKVTVCKTHHAEVHELASKVWDKKLPLESITDATKFKLVKAILDQRQVFARTGVAQEARRRIVAQLTVEEQQNVRLIKKDLGINSIENVLKFLINREAARIKAGKT